VDPDRSFERIYLRHRREVYGSVLRDVRDPEEAEDVTQAAFLNAFRAMRRGDRPEKPRAWLLTIARNVVRRRARLRAERPQEVELDTDLFLSPDDTEGSPSADIRDALRGLTDAQREAILLREIQGLSYAEIADELALSVSAVEALLFRARRALEEELQLVERVPVVRPRRRQGLLALPGLAKLGGFGFSFGRVGFACLVGCAVLGTGTVVDGIASDEPAAPVAAPAARDKPLSVSAPARERAHPKKGPKHRSREDKPAPASRPPDSASSESAGGAVESLLPVELPQVQPPVELPPVELPPVELPPAEVPPVPDPHILKTPNVVS
jgi:RNA polymerase sigma-70 factor, ECF subfamily